MPINVLLRPIMDMIDIWFIHGNHDTDQAEFWSNLYESDLANKTLHGRVCEVDGRRVTGLGGVFRQSVWMPGGESGDVQNHKEYCNQPLLRSKAPHVAENMKLNALSSIYPDDHYTLAMERAEILVAHEAPSCHPYGFAALDELVQSLGVQEAIHGHHHDSLDYREHWNRLGFRAYGVEFQGWKSV